MPARDEATTVCELVRRTRLVLGAPVLVVSDASSDTTTAEARRGGALVLELAVQLGAWGATQAGLRYARRHGYAAVVTLDADGQHDPATLPELVATLRTQGVDVVIGTFPERLSRARRLAWTWFRSLTGLAIDDLTSGLRVYGRRAIRVLAAPEATLLDYQDVGVLLLMRKHGLRVVEQSATMHARDAGRSRVFASWLLVARYMLQTTILCIARIGRLSPAPAVPASAARVKP